MQWMKDSNKDPHSQHARENAEYYLDQWFKILEKRVTQEIRDKKVKETAGDKASKVKKPKAEPELKGK